MDIIEPFEPIPFTQILYTALRANRPNYNANNYKWRLGAVVICEFESRYNNIAYKINTDEKIKLYGIDVEIDYLNQYNIQLFEDITNNMAVNAKGDI